MEQHVLYKMVGQSKIVPTQLSWAVVISHLLLMTKSQQGDANRTSQHSHSGKRRGFAAMLKNRLLWAFLHFQGHIKNGSAAISQDPHAICN